MKYFLFLLLLQAALLHAQEDSPYYAPQRPPQREGRTPKEEEPKTQTEQESIVPEDFFDTEGKKKRFEQIVDSRLNIHFGYAYAEMHDLVMASSDLDSDAFPLESRTDWKLQDILMLSASLESHIKRIYFFLGAKIPLILTDAPMSKRDWQFDNPPGEVASYDFPEGAESHYTSAGTRNEFSFSLEASLLFNLLKEDKEDEEDESGGAPHIELGATFLYMTWGITAEERKGLYLLDDAGVLGFNAAPSNEGDSINYRIHYLAPGLSMRFDVQWGIYGFEAFLNYSPSTFFISHHDYHVDNVKSDGFGVLGQMLWGGITNRFWLNEYVAFSIGLRGKVLFRTRIGSLVQENTDTGEGTSTENGAGSEYFDLEAFIGVTMGF